jgi:hypothetical protein
MWSVLSRLDYLLLISPSFHTLLAGSALTVMMTLLMGPPYEHGSPPPNVVLPTLGMGLSALLLLFLSAFVEYFKLEYRGAKASDFPAYLGTRPRMRGWIRALMLLGYVTLFASASALVVARAKFHTW